MIHRTPDQEAENSTGWQRAGRLCGALVLAGLLCVVIRYAGLTHYLLHGRMREARGQRPRTILRVWDWCSPAIDEKFGEYFAAVKREFERTHPDVEVVFQFVPFGQYEQKMATALVGNSPPDVFQSSVYWSEGFYDRGMLLPLNRFLERERAARESRRRRGLPIDPGEIVDREAYLDAAWRHNHKPDGTVFGIPQILDATCLAWNLTLLRKAAAADPEIRAMFAKKPDGERDYDHLRYDAVRDWAQFRRIARALTRYDPRGRLALDAKGDFMQAGFVIHAHGSGAGVVEPWFAANGTNFQDALGTKALFANAAGLEATQFLLDLYWRDHVSPPFRRQLSDDEVFNQGKVACVVAGTWAGKYITRNTEGRLRFDMTAFPPGPHGQKPSTLTWGNMLVIPRRSQHPGLAWEYIKFITSYSGSLRLLRYTEQNSPRKDVYNGPEWRAACAQYPYLHNVPAICASGRKLRHTQINATNYATQPIFETLLLRYPEIAAGRGPYPSVQAALQTAAAAADRIYRRYNAQVAQWQAAAFSPSPECLQARR